MRKISGLLFVLLRVFLLFFFDGRYLRGRFFERSRGGYIWALRAIWTRNVLRLGPIYPWPVGMGCVISNPDNLDFNVDDLNNFQSPGTYFQNFDARISIGKGCYIAPNVGIITANHDFLDVERHLPGADVRIGSKCWIGMNAVILPGVTLGDNVIVAAGAVVTRSFPEGYQVIGGVPARVIKTFDRNAMSEMSRT